MSVRRRRKQRSVKRQKSRGKRPLTRQMSNEKYKRRSGHKSSARSRGRRKGKGTRNVSDGLHFLSAPTRRYPKNTILEALEDFQGNGSELSAKRGDRLQVIFHNRYNFKNIIVRNMRTGSIGTFSAGLVRECSSSAVEREYPGVPQPVFSNSLDGNLPQFVDMRSESHDEGFSMEEPRRYRAFAIPKYAVGDLNGVRVSRTRKYGVIERTGNFIKILDENKKLLYLPAEFFDIEESVDMMPSPLPTEEIDRIVRDSISLNEEEEEEEEEEREVKRKVERKRSGGVAEDPFSKREIDLEMNMLRDQVNLKKAEIISLETRQKEILKELEVRWSELYYLEDRIVDMDQDYKKTEKKPSESSSSSPVKEVEGGGESGDLLECKICFEANISFGMSCGHCVCEKCHEDIKRRSMDCPFCRSEVDFSSTLKLFIT